MKKCLIIIGVILLTLFTINNYSQAAGTISLSANKSNAYIGDEFTISINLSGASVATLTTRITVDTSKVEYISGPSNSNFSNGKVIYTWTDPNGGASPISGGTIATFRFRAKSIGIANFSVTGDFYGANENVVKPTFSGKSIIISEVTSTPSQTPSTSAPQTGNTGSTTIPSNNTGTSTPSSTVSTNAYLKSLQLNVEGINPRFSKNTTQYYLTVSDSIDSINVTAIPENSSAKVTITGNTSLQKGLNKIVVLVTAQDGKNKKTYTVNVTKTDDPNKANANLENLAIEKCTLSPEFSPDVTEYMCDLEENISTLNILAVPQNKDAKIQIVGNENLQIGENSIEINVIAQDGTSAKIYSVKINKKEPSTEAVDQELQEQTEKVEPVKVKKNAAVIPLLILGIVAIIVGICYKKFTKKH